jgi:Na+-transporting methylmalonyl-CoA/oxaloacetate decarboxylase gamma subunit
MSTMSPGRWWIGFLVFVLPLLAVMLIWVAGEVEVGEVPRTVQAMVASQLIIGILAYWNRPFNCMDDAQKLADTRRKVLSMITATSQATFITAAVLGALFGYRVLYLRAGLEMNWAYWIPTAVTFLGWPADGINNLLERYQTPQVRQNRRMILAWLGTSKVASSGILLSFPLLRPLLSEGMRMVLLQLLIGILVFYGMGKLAEYFAQQRITGEMALDN